MHYSLISRYCEFPQIILLTSTSTYHQTTQIDSRCILHATQTTPLCNLILNTEPLQVKVPGSDAFWIRRLGVHVIQRVDESESNTKHLTPRMMQNNQLCEIVMYIKHIQLKKMCVCVKHICWDL